MKNKVVEQKKKLNWKWKQQNKKQVTNTFKGQFKKSY